jgi:hypothetical protein
LLRACRRYNGGDTKSKLNSFENTWASDPAIISAIIGLGQFFYHIDMGNISQNQPPEAVFPFIVSIILDALGEPLPAILAITEICNSHETSRSANGVETCWTFFPFWSL